jgi:DNA-binding XRE family transcriptional regulator
MLNADRFTPAAAVGSSLAFLLFIQISTTHTPAVRDKMRRAVEESGMTQEEIGLRMGFSKDSARKAVSRLLNANIDYDPRLSTLVAFAEAVNRRLKDLL